jgi:alpha,alpha-trehalase
MERDIAVFAELIGEKATAEIFSGASKARHTAIETILWNSEMEQWLDYWLPLDGNQVLRKLTKDISLISYNPIRMNTF